MMMIDEASRRVNRTMAVIAPMMPKRRMFSKLEIAKAKQSH
jgi:hypothetical protein